MLQARTKHSILQLFRWEILKEKKAEAIEETLEEVRHSKKMQRLVKLAHTYAIICQIFKNFAAKRERVRQHLMRVNVALRIKRAFSFRLLQ